MSQKTYLGQKGYSIYKNSISLKEQQFIRDELTVKPHIPGAPIKVEPYPIYQESLQKLYVPRVFGIKNFGEPQENKLSEPERISISFKGELKDYQEKIVNSYLKYIESNFGGLLEIPCGRGKTVMALAIMCLLKYKTLVVVHKTFLANQWIERIQEFVPNAKIGRIQGEIIDIEDKDIVIGMLQSLSMKEYSRDIFSQFGMLCVDEVHHLAAEVFVKLCQKVVTKHTLGLSATMYLGDVIYKEKRENNDSVLVKGINFTSKDKEFNEVEYDFRGQPKYSTLISKICSFNPRTELIISIISKELDKNKDQQMLVLAHNKSLLVYLYKAIEHRNIASVGYYIGGMKQEHLKQSENKTIILATYAMAAEALDIKSLTTLILATPKTSIEQAVGRILRVKHENPLIIDIIDEHSVFKNQWEKRKAFYNKNKYKILYTTNYELDSWLEIKPKNKKNDKKTSCLFKPLEPEVYTH